MVRCERSESHNARFVATLGSGSCQSICTVQHSHWLAAVDVARGTKAVAVHRTVDAPDGRMQSISHSRDMSTMLRCAAVPRACKRVCRCYGASHK